MMNVQCNGKTYVVDVGYSLYAFLSENNFDNKKGIAVAINNRVVQKEEWESVKLIENDSILIISATKGG